MTRPSAYQAALHIGGLGSGPASNAAAHALGLTTQVPSVVEVAVPGKTPDPFPGVRFRSVGALEVLADPLVTEVSPEQLIARNQGTHRNRRRPL